MLASIVPLFQERLIFLFFNPIPLLLLLLSLFFIYKRILPLSTTKKLNLPPSPPRLPIIGNLHQLGMWPHRSLRTLSQKYGDLMLLHLGSKPTVVVSSAEVASQVLKTHDHIFASRPNLSVFKRLFANGKDVLTSPYGEYCTKMRSICTVQLLSTTKVRSFRRVREEEVELMIKSIRGLSVVNLSDMFMSLTNDMICRVAFGKKYRRENDDIDFTKLLDEFFMLVGDYYIGDFISWLAWIDRIKGVDAKVRRVARTFDYFLERILEEHSSHTRERNGDEKEIVGDFVDVLLEFQRHDTSGNIFLDRESIKGLILDMFTAGTDTMSVVLEWMMSELLRNPSVMKELQKEIKVIIGDKETITDDDFEKMKYLKAVIKETLRLHPPAPLLPQHESTKDVRINGYDIVAGTLVIINAWAISTHPTHWKRPDKFDPERFLNSPVDFKGQDFQLIPFGSGRRICPGITLATSSIELVITNLLRQFDWALPDGVVGESLDMKENVGLTVGRKNPLIAIPTPRIT